MSAASHSAGGNSLSVSPPALSSQWVGGAGGGALVGWVAFVSSVQAELVDLGALDLGVFGGIAASRY